MKVAKLLVVIGVMMQYACNSGIHFEEFINIPDLEWGHDNTMHFDVEVIDTTQLYDIIINVRHSDSYTYRNMYIMIYTTFPTGRKLEQQIRLNLAEKSGKWKGKCTGDICMIQYPIQELAYFNEVGKYTFEIVQYMRDDPLHGIEKIGLILYKADLPEQ